MFAAFIFVHLFEISVIQAQSCLTLRRGQFCTTSAMYPLFHNFYVSTTTPEPFMDAGYQCNISENVCTLVSSQLYSCTLPTIPKHRVCVGTVDVVQLYTSMASTNNLPIEWGWYSSCTQTSNTTDVFWSTGEVAFWTYENSIYTAQFLFFSHWEGIFTWNPGQVIDICHS